MTIRKTAFALRQKERLEKDAKDLKCRRQTIIDGFIDGEIDKSVYENRSRELNPKSLVNKE